ncbi:DUF7159 family protein [Mycobacterium kubicae]|uniref:DUF7159 family protein n=1 Tax=Mycobacterium kubicae TaxID=120959 RepID=UPI0007FCBE34|nr:hypothetical protein [Mycobacterium kubicae]OBK55523.1 hypothetical protein A5657_11100 [Mycobacterium kubicae]
MDTVLGLSLTPTAVGWVLAEGHGADGTILDHHELALPGGRGASAVNTAVQVAEEVMGVAEEAATHDQRLRVIGVTWNDDASAQAALLVEALTDAGFDNVVPVRQLDAVETLAQAIAPIIGYDRTAVCILEHDWATVVMVDTNDGESQTAVKHVRGGYDGLTSWLTGMFDRSAWRPAGVVVVGSHADINEFSWHLENVLPVPVFAQTMAQVTVARGAALAAARSTEFTDAGLVTESGEPAAVRARSMQYTGAAAALAAAAVTFVASLSLAVGLELTPDKHSGTAQHAVHKSTAPVAESQAPALPTPAQVKSTVPVAAPQPPEEQEPVRLTSGGQIAQSKPNNVAPQPDPNGGPLLLTRVLEHIPGSFGAAPARPPQ